MSLDYPDTITLARGVTMTFQNQVRRVEVRGRVDDELLYAPTHWHENHDEIIHVLEGQLKVTLGSEVKICTPTTGDVFIPRGIPHSLQSIKEIACIFTERTNPEVFDTKELFFRNIFALQGRGGLLSVMQVFYHGDIFPAFPMHPVWLEKAFVIVLGGYIAPCLGRNLKYTKCKKN
ncbi:hypothetical protein GYMLUDRAFT_73347 [Collybiopsis luxurians FD-317 M1]|uniref:Cupin type-2 domain-containing protein n=1 Tax=Collybiopsis luxurians FD-317 M1 TaxID=944289 RepID=A0A0D0CQL2_9AGAR|nr:hypothetical protein GYMLUDRAFT_73347 [Collybiopsis luxurians FD-317 M1]